MELLQEHGASPFVLTAEHAGRCFPRRLESLGVSAEDRERHIAWDIGIRGVTRRLSALLDAPAVLQRYSRLVVDCNRWPTADEFVIRISDDTAIPGNVGLTDEHIQSRAREIFNPYHRAVTRILDARSARNIETVFVAMHSFTPVYQGVRRPWHVGVLYDKDPRFGRALLEVLAGEDGVCVGDNAPYAISSDRDYAVPVHGEKRRLPHVELEIRQDLIDTETGQNEWANRIAATLHRGLRRFRKSASGIW